MLLMKQGEDMYVAIIGDIIDSRKIVDGRSEVQERFKAAISNINDQYGNCIETNFAIIAGDGFYGLLHSPENLLKILLEIRIALVPHQIRIGIGIGSIDTEIVKNESNSVDGRANATAREAIDFLSENKRKYESVYRTTMLKIDSALNQERTQADCKNVSLCKAYEDLVNAIFCSCSGIESKWNRKHVDTIKLRVNKYTQREIATKLGISQSAVQKRMISADFYTYEYYLAALGSGIDELWKEVQYV
jgi:hypothetical protein